MLDLDRVRGGLTGSRFGPIVYTAETSSTNDDAVPLLGLPQHAGRVLIAEHQTAGRGRRERAWIAPAGSALLFTTILPDRIAGEALWGVTLWCALAVADGIAAAGGPRVELQWPNDLLLGGRKCCGILCSSRIMGAHAWVACGVGINVLRPAGAASLAAISPPPAFLSDHSNVDRPAVLAAILRAYDRRLDELRDPPAIARAWERRAALAGTRYRIAIDGADQPFDAIARRIADDGSLVVSDGHRERHIAVGDARVLRPLSTS
ncbi:MAG: biotin--[acetyl-CoA-carboxylase] ligase [Vulcanimicrobiaceae bacterium]